MDFHWTDCEDISERRYVRIAMTSFIHIGQDMCTVPAEIHLGPAAQCDSH